MNLVKKLAIGFLVIVLLLIALVTFLVATPAGLQLLIHGAARWVPGLEIGSVSGGWRDLRLTDIRYQMPGVEVHAGQFQFGLDLGCLQRSELCINRLVTQDVDVVVKTAQMVASTAEPNPQPLTELSTPYPISVRNVALNNINVAVDETRVTLVELTTAAAWQQRSLTLLPTAIRGLTIALPAASEPAPTAPTAPTAPATPLVEQLKAMFSKPLLPQLPEIILPLDLTIDEIKGEQLRLSGDTELLIDQLVLQASNRGQQIQLDRFTVEAPQGNLFVQAGTTLDDDWPLAMTLSSKLNVAPLNGQQIKLNISGNLRKQQRVVLNLLGPVVAQLDLQTELAKAGLPLSLTVESKRLRWPLTGQAAYQLQDFRLRFTGKATNYVLSTRGQVKGQALPDIGLFLDGKGDLTQFNLQRLRISALGGNSDLSGVVDWSNTLSWNSQLLLRGINTAKQWPEWPAQLEGLITTRGSIQGGHWQLQVPELRLDGRVKQNSLSARGSLRGNAAGQWIIPGVELTLGRNKLAINGQLDEKNWALDANVDAQHLDGALPGLAGNIKGLLRLSGNLQAPQVLADISAKNLRWQELRIKQVKLDGNVRSAEQVQGQLTLRVEQLRQEGLRIKQLVLNANGNERQHRLTLNIDGKPVAGQLALDGRFDRSQQRWRASLANVRFDTPVGEWRTNQPIALDYRHTVQRISIGAHCWNNPNAQLCVPNSIDAGSSGEARVVLNRLDLAMVQPFLEADTAVTGRFTGQADVRWQPNGGLPQTQLSLIGNGVKLVQQVQGSALPLSFEKLNLNLALNNTLAKLDWLVKLHNNGQFQGNIQVTDPQQRRGLGGNISINNLSLALLKPILARGEKAEGVLNANLQLRGQVQNPQLFGRLALEKVAIVSSWLPFDMTEGRLAINFDGLTSSLDGLLATTQGKLTLSGGADWRNLNAWRARVAAKGDRLRLTIPPMVRIDVSPDLVFEATPNLLSLNGSVDIPWARIKVQELPETAVGISPDEVMLNRKLQPIEPASTSIPINSNLMIRVGNNVSLEAFGLNAMLRGNLRVVQERNRLGLTGQINIPSGRFRAYGQDLLVRQGQLIFSGPADQPLLNIEAIRNPNSIQGEVTAGVRVTGMADAPRLEVFSDPAMSQQEALSYLLRGQGLDSSGADGNAMTAMLIGMGLAQSGQLVGKIGEAFGVSNLALNTEGAGENSQVVVSGYVLPGLQVKYGVGIFDSLATLTLRYRLMPRLYLEAVSGIDQALDVLYQFEF
ncbi:autotransporter assembly complex protein TamB [Serratia microhaemolytica]|uniref:autotransporter assembly complex protein TamB n=1 Tax=Serratia microhaemolytica TaxID=2675110 RepID=UPI000FDD01F9|nr:translocation/assembly module TamB domain-containing protein [Serratia microhaemolytica]